MSLAKKTTTWVEQGFISAEQQQKILSFERTHSNKTFWNTAIIIAGLLIGLGVCLLIAANWKVLPAAVKLTGDFVLLGALIYATHRSLQLQRNGLKELFAILSFLLIGGSIGLIGQVFHLSGSWERFAVGWAVLGLPFVLLSRSSFLNMGWIFLLLTSYSWEQIWRHIELVLDQLPCAACIILIFYVLHMLLVKFCETTDKWFQLPRAAATFVLWMSYGLLCYVAVDSGLSHGKIMAYLFVFAFLAFRMFTAAKEQHLKSFKRNAILAELYIFLIFAYKIGSLWLSGFGFIGAGILLLLFIWILRKTTRYIKQMEIFQ